MSTPLVELQGVSIAFAGQPVVHDLDLTVNAGERVALVGESGSGKTVTALSILRLVPRARITGRILFQDRDLTRASEAEIRDLRGSDVAMIFQEPMTALNPLYSVGNQIIETLALHEGLQGRAARERAIELLARTGVRQPERRVDSYPHQMSGGQRQRAMIAMALACRPKLLIADEPTTALDVSTRARIVRTLLELQEEENRRGGDGLAILLISHDLNLVRHFAQRVVVMEQGRVVESGATEQVFCSPQHPYTSMLLASQPKRQVTAVADDAPVVLETRQLRVEYPKARSGWRGWFSKDRFAAVASADLQLREGETIGIVGESGSGKSTLSQAILGLQPTCAGEIVFDQRKVERSADWRVLRKHLQAVFQDPFASLSPKYSVQRLIGEGLGLHFPELDESQRRDRVLAALDDVGLPLRSLRALSHEFSGGQRQRISIARALIVSPRVVVLDEPTSSLDVSIQNQILRLLSELQRKYRLSYVLVSHDLAVIRAMAHRIYVMKDGHIVESGETETVITQPTHAYTRELVEASF
ncbi:ABC transporter ATP-binding protein [Steroidobacter sp.]|uniref:ABC transporter ATP-binding protein n=1 Tax=Steroidobacter sp. TaxID=1978227 RepID=UPI001A3D1854|nr:dipeptide ABC transporter ATP-binding protein [Steroidobacter sp.]MBL8267389.1 ABC transporter ATP-binding protein [Steroidobacter sp.]